MSISEKEGKLLLHCFAGCSFPDIIKALGIQNTAVEQPQIVATYDYTDSQGGLLYQVVRYSPKSFKQRRPDPGKKDEWIWNLNGIKPILYHLPEVIKAIGGHNLIWIVEGEKDVNNLRAQGQVATTISGGSSAKWHPSLIPLFLNATVAIIPDSDEPGRKYAQSVANLLYGIASSVKLIILPDKDVSDYLKTESLNSLLNILHNTREFIPSGVVTREEFNELRGLNIYLLRSLMVKSKRKYNTYE